MDQALNSQKTPHTSPLRTSYGMSFVSILMKNDRVIKGFYCILLPVTDYFRQPWQLSHEGKVKYGVSVVSSKSGQCSAFVMAEQ